MGGKNFVITCGAVEYTLQEHKLTDNGAGKRESEGESLGNGTCPMSLLACEDSRKHNDGLEEDHDKVQNLEEVDDKDEDPEDAGGNT